MTYGRYFYPLVLTKLDRSRCVVVGGGAVAERKVRGLLDGGARPVVISPQLTPALLRWRTAGLIEHWARSYQEGDLAGAVLVIAATDDAEVNAAVAAEGERLGLLVNLVDDASAGSFHTVAAVRRGDLLLTVSTGGAAPALSARIRDDLAGRYGEEYGRLLSRLRALRGGAADGLDPMRRRRLWRSLFNPEVLGWLRAGAVEQFERYLERRIAQLQHEQVDEGSYQSEGWDPALSGRV